jgi:hypothetical protein
MTQPDPAGESLAALASALADLRGQVLVVNQRLDAAGLTGDLNLAERFEALAATVADALKAITAAGPPAPVWIGMDKETYDRQLAELTKWVDAVLRAEYGGYDLRDCWANHHHVIWELSTLATEWHRTYGGRKPDLARALDFYDRWLPNTMRRVNGYTSKCVVECSLISNRRY